MTLNANIRNANIRIVATHCLIAAFATGWSQDGWKKPESISAAFSETYGASTRTISVYQSGRDIAVQSTIGINGALEGVPRIEAISEKGIYTWIAGKPEQAMMLAAPTFPEFYGFLVAPRFSRADLEFNLKGIEKALNKPVQAGKRETIAGRECLVLVVLDRPDSGGVDYQKLWIDVATGIALRVQDFFGGKLTYERSATDIKYNSLPEGFLFSPPEGAIIIKGPVSAETLLRLPTGRPAEDLSMDLAKINAAPKAGGELWARALNPKDPFRYAQTTYREQVGHIIMGGGNAASQRSPGRGNQIGGQWSQQIVITRPNDSGDIVQVITGDAGGAISLTATQLPQTRTGEVASGQGTATPPNPPGQSNQGTQGTNQNRTTTALVAKSDFVDPNTGDTVVFIQVKGGPAEAYLGQLVLGPPKVLNVSQLSQARSYSVTSPYKLTVISWQIGEVRCALAATNLDENRLIEIAKTIRQ